MTRKMIPTRKDIDQAIERLQPIIKKFNDTQSARVNHKQKMDIDMVGLSIGLPKLNYFCSSCVANSLKRISAWQTKEPTQPTNEPKFNVDDLKGLKKTMLVEIAKTNNVSPRGTKAEMIERLVNA